MELFEMVLNPETIYDTLFMNIKVVAEHEKLEMLSQENEDLYYQWIDISNKNYGITDDRTYHMNAINYPEFSKIAAISIGVMNRGENGKLNRILEPIKGKNEVELIQNFFEVFNMMGGSKKYMCGHQISSHIIPFLCKRAVKHGIVIPGMIKKTLFSKPWDGNLIDTALIWKFNSIGFNSLEMIKDFLGLKTNIKLRKAETISGYYYNSDDREWLEKQSINETNLCMQFLYKMREV